MVNWNPRNKILWNIIWETNIFSVNKYHFTVWPAMYVYILHWYIEAKQNGQHFTDESF